MIEKRLDVKYGNRLFVHSGENGYLVDFNYVIQDEELIHNMAEKIIAILADEKRLQEFHENSYKIGKKFFTENNSKKWKELLKNGTECLYYQDEWSTMESVAGQAMDDR